MSEAPREFGDGLGIAERRALERWPEGERVDVEVARVVWLILREAPMASDGEVLLTPEALAEQASLSFEGDPAELVIASVWHVADSLCAAHVLSRRDGRLYWNPRVRSRLEGEALERAEQASPTLAFRYRLTDFD